MICLLCWDYPWPKKTFRHGIIFFPLIEEFQQLHQGISDVIDGSKGKGLDSLFQAHAYIVMVGADMPARGKSSL